MGSGPKDVVVSTSTAAGLLLAVDGGGTQTRAVVADLAGNVLARGLGPAGNHHRVGLEGASRAMITAIEGALQQVAAGSRPNAARPGWSNGRIAAACFGLAGVNTPEDEALLSSWVKAQAIAPRFTVLNDSELILAAGTPDGWGVILISGTGSVCLARSREGRTIRVGGWGPLLGDEGSGYQIALRALKAATQSADGRSGARALLQAILDHWSLPSAEALIPYVYEAKRGQSDLATLAPVVLDLAERGDPTASAIRDKALRELIRHVEAAEAALGVPRPPLALAGGVLVGNMRRHLIARVEDRFSPVTYVEEPSLGGIRIARRLLSDAGTAALAEASPPPHEPERP